MTKNIKPNMSNEKTPKKRARCSNWEENRAAALRDWVTSREDIFSVEEFLFLNDIPQKTWDDGVARNPVLKAANDYANMKCGINRERLAIKRNESISSTNSFALPNYLKRWRDIMEWRTELKKSADNEATTLNVTIENYPESDLVPKKKNGKKTNQDQ